MADRLGPEYVTTIRDAIAYLHEETARLIVAERGMYAKNSQADKEHSTCASPDAIFIAIGIAGQLVETGDEHLSVFAKILVQPIEITAAWTCIRSMLESCALAAWLLDPDIDANARVSRVFALRYEGMEQYKTLARAMNAPAADIAAQEARIDAVENDAKALGFARVHNSKQKRMGIGEKMPSATHLIRDVLDEEKMYRMLSGVVHGHHWAIRQLSYVESAENDEQIGRTFAKAFRKAISVDKVALLNLCGVRAFIRALWNECRYCGWNSLYFEEVFENVADRLQMTTPVRFWRY